jgi:uncharacterized Zn finger protein (UPF0148 family)
VNNNEDYYEYHESKESLMGDGRDNNAHCDICGCVILEATDGLDLCVKCYDQQVAEDEEPEIPEEA